MRLKPQNKWAAQLVGIWLCLCLSIGTVLVVPSCGSAPAILKTAGDIVTMLGPVLGFIEKHAKDRQLVTDAVEAIAEKDAAKVMTTLTRAVVVIANEDDGVEVPPWVYERLGRASAAMFGLTEGLRALACTGDDRPAECDAQ